MLRLVINSGCIQSVRENYFLKIKRYSELVPGQYSLMDLAKKKNTQPKVLEAPQSDVFPSAHEPQAIIDQPKNTSSWVSTQQGLGTRGWSSGICDCFDDGKSCFLSWLCGNFYYACIASRMGENCCVGCSGYPSGCVPGGHLAMRSRFRGTHKIDGDICTDCIINTCCLPCAMCQLSREMDRLGYPRTLC